MELNLQRQTIAVNETVFHGSVEQPIECDALLPDYCPDIVKVLKCGTVTHVDSAVVSGERLTIEGMAVCHIYYASAENRIRHVEYKVPFGKSVELRAAPVSPSVSVVPSVDYVNCRAVNQRRLDVRGAVSFAVKVTDQREAHFVTDASGGGMQLRREMVKTTQVQGHSQSTFPVIEELELGYGKPPVGNIIRSDAHVHLADHKVVSGKVVAKGDFILHILYQPMAEDDKPEVMEYRLPLSQIIDCDAADEDSICDIDLYVATCELEPIAGDDGENRAFSLDARLGANVTAHRHIEVPVAGDAYSTRYESGCKHAPVSFMRLDGVVSDTVPHKMTLELPDGVDCVLDAWCDVDTMTWKQEADGIGLDMKLSVCLFARMDTGECLYFEQQTDFAHHIGTNYACDEVSFDPSCDVLSCAYSLSGKEQIDIRCEIAVRGCVHCLLKKQTIADITLDESREKQKEQNKLYIYYADEGESVWDIAKRYNTSPAAIWEENGMETDRLDSKSMLLIPIV